MTPAELREKVVRHNVVNHRERIHAVPSWLKWEFQIYLKQAEKTRYVNPTTIGHEIFEAGRSKTTKINTVNLLSQYFNRDLRLEKYSLRYWILPQETKQKILVEVYPPDRDPLQIRKEYIREYNRRRREKNREYQREYRRRSC